MQNTKQIRKSSSLFSRVFPFMDDLRNATSKSLKSDLMAGLSVAPIAVPQVMGYAVIAGLPPQYGLYAMTFAVMVAALWGSSRFLVAGPTNAISIVLFATVAQASIGGVVLSDLPVQEMLPYIFAIGLLAGLIQVVMGLARLGSLANYISHAVMVGFSTGAALLIFSGQLKNILNIEISGANFFGAILKTIQNIGDISYLSLALGLLSIAVIVFCKRISARIPAYLVALIVSSLVAYIFNLQSKGLAFVSPIPAGLPPLSMPKALSLDILRDIFNPALAIAMLATVESITIGKSLANLSNTRIHASKELVGQGLGNMVSAFTSGIPGCGSFSRSSLNFASGATSRFASFFTGLITLPIIVFFAPLADNIPMAALAGILIYIAYKAIDVHSIKLCLVATKVDRFVFLVTIFACLLIDLEKAVFLGVLLSLALIIYKEAHPRVKCLQKESITLEEFKWVKNCPNLEIYFVEGTLFFGAVANLEDEVHEAKDDTEFIILNLTRVFWVDATGAHGLAQFAKRCHVAGVKLIIVVADESVQGVLERTKALGHGNDTPIFLSFEEGLRYTHELMDDTCKK